MELQTQLNSSNQWLLRLQDQLSAIPLRFSSEQENRLENIKLIVEELRLGAFNNPASSCGETNHLENTGLPLTVL